MTLAQLSCEFEIREVPPQEVNSMLLRKRAEVFDKVCERFNLTPSALASKEPKEIASMLVDTIGGKSPVDEQSIPQHIRDYIAFKTS